MIWGVYRNEDSRAMYSTNCLHLGQRLASNRRRKYVDQVISGDIQDGSSTVFYGKAPKIKTKN